MVGVNPSSVIGHVVGDGAVIERQLAFVVVDGAADIYGFRVTQGAVSDNRCRALEENDAAAVQGLVWIGFAAQSDSCEGDRRALDRIDGTAVGE